MEKQHSETEHDYTGILRKSSTDSSNSGGARRKEYATPRKCHGSRGSRDDPPGDSEAEGCGSDTGESPKRRVRVKVDFDTEIYKSKRHYNLNKLAEQNRAKKKQHRDMKTVKSCEDFRHKEKHSSPHKSCENLKGGYVMRSHRPGRVVAEEVNGYSNKSCENLSLLKPGGSPLKRNSYHRSYEDLLTGKGLKEGQKDKKHQHQQHGKSSTSSPAHSPPDHLRQTSNDKTKKETADKTKGGKDKKKDPPRHILHHTIKIEKWNDAVDGKCTTENMQKKFRMQAFSCGQHIVVPGKGLPDHNSEEARRIGLVEGSLVAELYGRRIRLHPGDIIELPAGQRNCGDAEGEDSATIIFGTKQGCLIS